MIYMATPIYLPNIDAKAPAGEATRCNFRLPQRNTHSARRQPTREIIFLWQRVQTHNLSPILFLHVGGIPKVGINALCSAASSQAPAPVCPKSNTNQQVNKQKTSALRTAQTEHGSCFDTAPTPLGAHSPTNTHAVVPRGPRRIQANSKQCCRPHFWVGPGFCELFRAESPKYRALEENSEVLTVLTRRTVAGRVICCNISVGAGNSMFTFQLRFPALRSSQYNQLGYPTEPLTSF